MFKKHALKVTVIPDDDKPNTQPRYVHSINAQQINEIAEKQIKNVSVAIVSVYVAKSVTRVFTSAALHLIHAKIK